MRKLRIMPPWMIVSFVAVGFLLSRDLFSNIQEIVVFGLSEETSDLVFDNAIVGTKDIIPSRIPVKDTEEVIGTFLGDHGLSIGCGDLRLCKFSTPGVIHNNKQGILFRSLIVNDDIDVEAAIADTKLAVITTAGKVLNSATSANSCNTVDTIVCRDNSGDFQARTIALKDHGSLQLSESAGNKNISVQAPPGS